MICITCNQPMTPGGDRPPSMGNPNMCVECVVEGFIGKPLSEANPFPNGRWIEPQFPADGSAADSSTDGASNLPAGGPDQSAHNGERHPEVPRKPAGILSPKQTITGPPPGIYEERWGNRE